MAPTHHKLNSIQKQLLDIYLVIKQICEKHSIRFFAVGGTALGAVRHQGFIPWDDDIDIGMPIEDFIKFTKICKKELPKPYRFSPLHILGGKVHSTNTTFIEAQCAFADQSQYYGVFIDIFPIIGLPNQQKKRVDFLKDMNRYFIKAFVLDRYPTASKLSKKDIEAWQKKLLYSYSLEDSKFSAEFATGFTFIKNTSGMKNPIIMDFEHTTIPVPSTFDEDLTNQYGDYHKIPPVNERHVHNKYALIDYQKSYQYYYEKIEKIDPKILKFLKLKDEQEGLFFNDLQQINLEHNELIEIYNLQNQELTKLRFDLDQIINSRSYKLMRKLQKISAILKH